MKIEGLKITECESSKELMELYNSWVDEQGFSSQFIPSLPCWSDFVNYGNEHKEEARKFALEYLTYWQCDWIILNFVDYIFGSPIDYTRTSTEYVSPKNPDVKLCYQMYLGIEINKEN